MDDPSLLPYLNTNTNGNGHHYGMDIEEDDDDDDELDEQQYPEDDIDDEREFFHPPPPSAILPSQERGGRRKGVPRRLQISPPKIKSPSPIHQSIAKASSTNQIIVTSDEELNNENDYYHHHHHREIKDSNGIESDYYPSTAYFDEDEYDENNNMNLIEDENIFEIVDDILADIVTIIVRDIRQQRQKLFKQRFISHTNGHMKSQEKYSNGKDFHPSNSIKPSKRLSDPTTLLNEFTKIVQPTSSQQMTKTLTSPPLAKRQKITDSTLSLQQQHQQLLWQMTQQLMMANTSDEITENSSLLKQQLLGLTSASSSTVPKRVGRPPKQQIQSPQVMRSSTNMIPPISNSTSYERANFAPRRRGRPPKYVTERAAIPGLASHDLDPMPYDQLFAAIENSVTGNSSRTSSAAFQSALASMLGQQSGLTIPTLSIPTPTPPAALRNGVPASMVKQSAGQTRHSLPTSSNGSNMPLMATKKRGPGRPPKSQLLIDSHQVLQATKRINSPSSLSNTNNNNFPPTMVPSSPTSFNLNAAFVEMLQQQQQHPR